MFKFFTEAGAGVGAGVIADTVMANINPHDIATSRIPSLPLLVAAAAFVDGVYNRGGACVGFALGLTGSFLCRVYAEVASSNELHTGPTRSLRMGISG